MPENDSDLSPIAQVTRQIELSSLDREVENLPEGLREPVVEHYILGYSARQIADRMDLSTSAVEGRLRRGRRLLRHRLALRGISLSVVVSGAAWLRDHSSTAYACDQWTSRMLDLSDSSSSTLSERFSSTDPYISQLVNGELAMRLTMLKPIALTAAAVAVTVSVSVFALAVQTDGLPGAPAGQASGAPVAVTAPTEEPVAQSSLILPSKPVPQPVQSEALVEQRREAVNTVTKPSDAATKPSDAVTKPSDAVTKPSDAVTKRSEPATKGATAPAAATRAAATSATPTAFVRPEGGFPNWLTAGNEDITAREELREQCRQPVSVDYSNTPLTQAIETLAAQAEVNIIIDANSLSDVGVDPSAPVTLTIKGAVPLCEALEMILDPVGLAYEVQDRVLRVTSSDNIQGSTRYYDLAYVLPNTAGINDLVRTIQATVTSGEWEGAGGSGTIGIIGSLMVINAQEEAHRQIEKLLAELARMNPENLKSSSNLWPQNSFGGMGGMGGVGTGGGGGGFF